MGYLTMDPEEFLHLLTRYLLYVVGVLLLLSFGIVIAKALGWYHA